MITLDDIREITPLTDSEIVNVYLFGSRIYKTESITSDWDVIIVTTKDFDDEVEYNKNNINIHLLSIKSFRNKLEDHHIGSLECINAPKWAILKEDIKFNIDIESKKLRHSISSTNSNSWVKCKKKLFQNDYEVGIKSLFHSIRISMFGIQLASNGVITDWECANYIWRDLISKDRWTWEEVKEKYTGIRNSKMSEFRLLTNK